MAVSDFETRMVGGYEKLVTPTDHTGLPFCFAPTAGLPRPGSYPVDRLHPAADLNHQFPKHNVQTGDHPVLTDDVARTALSQLRVQWVDYRQHHGPYNHLFADPVYPETPQALFQTLAAGDAGYVPEQAIDLSGKVPKIIGLTKKQRKWLWTSGQVRTSCPSAVRGYMRRYVIEQDVDHIDRGKVEDFIYVAEREERVRLAQELAVQVTERAAEPIEPVFQEARREGVLTYVQVGSVKKGVPNNSRDLLLATLWGANAFGRMQADLHARLAREDRDSFQDYFAKRFPHLVVAEPVDQQG